MSNNKKEYLKEYYQKNKEKIKEQKQEFYRENKEKVDSKTNKYRDERPYLRFLVNCRQRCGNPRNPNYSRYGAKGIKCLLTLEEIKLLWERDEADKLIRPSLDRKNSKGHYELTNCRFIELVVNTAKKLEEH